MFFALPGMVADMRILQLGLLVSGCCYVCVYLFSYLRIVLLSPSRFRVLSMLGMVAIFASLGLRRLGQLRIEDSATGWLPLRTCIQLGGSSEFL